MQPDPRMWLDDVGMMLDHDPGTEPILFNHFNSICGRNNCRNSICGRVPVLAHVELMVMNRGFQAGTTDRKYDLLKRWKF